MGWKQINKLPEHQETNTHPFTRMDWLVRCFSLLSYIVGHFTDFHSKTTRNSLCNNLMHRPMAKQSRWAPNKWEWEPLWHLYEVMFHRETSGCLMTNFSWDGSLCLNHNANTVTMYLTNTFQCYVTSFIATKNGTIHLHMTASIQTCNHHGINRVVRV